MSLFPTTAPELRSPRLVKRGGERVRRPAPHATGSSGQTRVDQTFRRHAAEMRPYLHRRGVVGGDADDVLQRVFLVLLRRIEDIVPGSERAFLFRAVAYEVAHVRRSFARRGEQPEDGREESTADSVRPDELLMDKVDRELLDRALVGLDAGLRETLELVAFEELSLIDVAARLRIPVGTAKTRLRRARAVLASVLALTPQG